MREIPTLSDTVFSDDTAYSTGSSIDSTLERSKRLLSLDELENIDVPFNELLFSKCTRKGEERRSFDDRRQLQRDTEDRRSCRDRRLYNQYL